MEDGGNDNPPCLTETFLKIGETITNDKEKTRLVHLVHGGIYRDDSPSVWDLLVSRGQALMETHPVRKTRRGPSRGQVQLCPAICSHFGVHVRGRTKSSLIDDLDSSPFLLPLLRKASLCTRISQSLVKPKDSTVRHTKSTELLKLEMCIMS